MDAALTDVALIGERTEAGEYGLCGICRRRGVRADTGRANVDDEVGGMATGGGLVI
jgi:hypothetical protein